MTLTQAAPHAHTWAAAVESFAAHLARVGQPSPASADDYCRRVLTYSSTLPADPWRITTAELQADLDSRNWSRATRKTTLVALRRFYAWAVLSGRVERSPLLGIPDGMPKRPGPLLQSPARLWHEAVCDYLTTLRAAGRRPATVTLYRKHLTTLSLAFAHPWQVSSDDLALYLSQPDWSPEYRRSVRSVIRGFYRWAVLTDRLDRDPTVPLAAVSVPRSLPRPAPDSAVLEGLDRADDRTRLALELGMYAGLRIAEVAGLAVADVSGDRLRVTGKGGHQRYVPLHPVLRESIAAERSRRAEAGEGPSPWLFPSVQGGHISARYLGKLVSAVLPDGWTAHTLRHRFATQAYAAQRDLRAVQELLGHARPETTARYAAVPDDALASAVAAVGLPLDRRVPAHAGE